MELGSLLSWGHYLGALFSGELLLSGFTLEETNFLDYFRGPLLSEGRYWVLTICQNKPVGTSIE